jgi:hypothetical protein
MSPKEMKKIHGIAFYHVDDFVAALGYHPTGVNFGCYGVITQANRKFSPGSCSPSRMQSHTGDRD